MPTSGNLTFAQENLHGGARTRLAEAILYICNACETDAAFGKTRLNKILFEADFQSFLIRLTSVTGAAYQRLRWGPAPIVMPTLLNQMQISGEIVIKSSDFIGRKQEKPICLREPNLDFFSGYDIAFLDAQVQDSWGKTATDVSHASHRIEWSTREDRDPIPYEAVWLSNEPLTSVEIQRTRDLASEHGW